MSLLVCSHNGHSCILFELVAGNGLHSQIRQSVAPQLIFHLESDIRLRLSEHEFAFWLENSVQ